MTDEENTDKDSLTDEEYFDWLDYYTEMMWYYRNEDESE